MGVTVTQAEKDAFAAKVQAWRKREGYSQRDGAIALGIPKRTLQGWELATRKPIALTERMILAVIEPKKRKAKK
jgi:DNA-binding transcriptional regulator YiaG